MKKLVFAVLMAIFALPTMLNAQVFTNSLDGWKGKVGKRNTGVPSVNNLQITWTAATLTSAQLQTQQGSAIGTYCGGNNRVHDNDIHQFTVNSGADAAAASNHVAALSRAPQGYTSAIRLGYYTALTGDPGADKTASMMYKDFYVDPATNGLITIRYACVFMNPGGGNNTNQIVSFAIKKGTNGSQGVPATAFESAIAKTKAEVPLCQIIVAPQLARSGMVGSDEDTVYLPSGWHLEGDPAHSNQCDAVWCDYQTLQFDLREFAGSWVRLECCATHSSDGHGGYVYFVGETGPTMLNSVECNPGENPPTITMTSGYQNYVWYRSAEGFAGNLSDLAIMDTGIVQTGQNVIRAQAAGQAQPIRFLKVTDDSTQMNTYGVQPEDFVVSGGANDGDPLASQVFIGRGTCSRGVNGNVAGVGPSYPVYYIVRMDNKKPTLVIDTLFYCNASVFLSGSRSTCTDPINESLTHWDVYLDYQEGAALGTPHATIYQDTITYHFPRAGRHAVMLSKSTSNENCRSAKLYPINVVSAPNVSLRITPTVRPCPGTPTTLSFNTAEAVNDEWTIKWSFSDGTEVENLQTTQHTFTLPHDPFSLEVMNGSVVRDALGNITACKTSLDSAINVFVDPNVVPSGDTVLCSGETTDFKFTVEGDDGQGAYSYQWYKDETCTQTACAAGPTLRVNPVVTPENQQKTYYMTVKSTAQGCVTAPYPQEFTILTVGLTPAVQYVCTKSEATLTAIGASDYDWSPSIADTQVFGSGNAVTQIMTATPSSDVTYTVVGHGLNGCTTQPASATIHVVPYPKQSFIYDPLFVDAENPTLTFRDQSSPLTSSRWVFENTNEMTGQQVEYTFTELTGDFVTVLLQSTNTANIGLATERSCTSDTLFKIDLDRFLVWVPNAFTPRLSNENREFKIYTINRLEHFTIYIYDRKGQMVYSSTDQDFAWDGTFKGNYCPQGAYTYVMRYRRPHTADIYTKQGSLMLLW